MLQQLGYTLGDKLHESASSLVLKATEDSTGASVVVKLLRPSYPSNEAIERFRHEYELLEDCKALKSVVSTRGWLELPDTRAIVMELVPGVTLRSFVQTTAVSTEDFYDIAMQLLSIVEAIHQKGILHKDLTPANILIDPQTRRLTLIDFGISSRISQQSAGIQNMHELEGTLAWIAPEQTGKINRMIDYRSDFYTMGGVFYYLLSGHAPFHNHDALELVHAHLARMPQPIHELNPNVPKALSDIVARLMAKAAENRYQSIHGLRSDLEICLEAFRQKEDPVLLVLGEEDIAEVFRFPQGVFGRERQTQTLLEAFERTCIGSTEMVLVEGESGSGKSALVHEFQSEVAAREGEFYTGKFERFQQEIPYQAFVQILRQMLSHWLSKDDALLQQQKKRLEKVLGPNSPLLFEWLPELELLVESHPTPPPLSPREESNRFHWTLVQLWKSLASSENPKLVFFDDLQWADSASLRLLETIVTQEDSLPLLIIGALRPKEAQEHLAWVQFLERLQARERPWTSMLLQPLTAEPIAQWLAEAMRLPIPHVQPLATLLFDKTRGNPFFLRQFVQALLQRELLTFDSSARRWTWQLQLLRNQKVTSNVAELLTQRLEKLSPELREVLSWACCLGTEFTSAELSHVLDKDEVELREILREGIKAELLLSITSRREAGEDTPAIRSQFRFVHDRLTQVFYDAIMEGRKEQIHYTIGRRLLRHTEQLQQKLFTIVSHLQRGLACIHSEDLKKTFVHLCIQAARRARNSAAPAVAYSYLLWGMESVEKDAWEQDYSLMLELHHLAVETAFLSSQISDMESWVQKVMEHSREPLDRVPAVETQIQAYSVQNRFSEAIDVALALLPELGVELPERTDRVPAWKAKLDFLSFFFSLFRLQHTFKPARVNELLDKPATLKPEIKAAMRLLDAIMPPSYIVDQQLCIHIILKEVSLSMKYGHTSESIIAFCNLGILLGVPLKRLDTSYRSGLMALEMMDRFAEPRDRARILMTVNAFARHWKDDLRVTLPSLEEGYEQGLQHGNLEFASVAAHVFCNHALMSGHRLSRLERKIVQYNRAMESFQQWRPLSYNKMLLQALTNLRSDTKQTYRLLGEHYNEDEQIKVHQEHKDQTALGTLYILKLFLACVFGEYDKGLQYSNHASKLLEAVASSNWMALFHFYSALALMGVARGQAGSKKRKTLKLVRPHLKKLSFWGKYVKHREYKALFLRAEMEWCKGHIEKARLLFRDALNKAREVGYSHDIAMIHEHFALYYQGLDEPGQVQFHLLQARQEYQTWGASTKVEQMEREHPEVLSLFLARPSSKLLNAHSTDSQTSTRGLDLYAVIEAYRTVSEALELSKVLTRIMEVVVASAGAERGYLLLQEQGEWKIEASMLDEVVHVDSRPLFDKEGLIQEALARTVLQFVIRTGRALVLKSACEEGSFVQDEHIRQQQVQSLLCMPLLHRGEVSGILYLENNWMTAAFDAQRTELLQVLSSQFIISIENARLYEDMEEKVNQRTQRLRQKQEELNQALEHLRTQHEQLIDAQQQLVQSEKMASLGTLVAGVAHEMFNPTTFVQSGANNLQRRLDDFSDWMNDAIEDEDDEELIDYVEGTFSGLNKNLEAVLDGTRRIRNVLNNLRIFSREGVRTMQSCQIVEGLEATIGLVKTNFKRKINYEMSWDDDPVIIGQPSQLNQVFLNMLMNASQSIAEKMDNHADFKEGRILVQTYLHEGYLAVEFVDNGLGISEANRKKIFDPFFTTKEVGEGMGLGLSLSFGIIAEHGGRIEVDSEVGEGACFTILLPLKSTLVSNAR